MRHVRLATPSIVAIGLIGSVATMGGAILIATPAAAQPFFFSTGLPDGKMATASRPSSAGKIEIEVGRRLRPDHADEPQQRHVHGTPAHGRRAVGHRRRPRRDLSRLPQRLGRGPHLGPADIQHAAGAHAGQLAFRHRIRRQERRREQSDVRRRESSSRPSPRPTRSSTESTRVPASIRGATARSQVRKSSSTWPSRRRSRWPPITSSSCPRYSYRAVISIWLSAPRPIVPPGTPFPAGFTDLQEWIRNEDLAPDWLRVGADIVGGTPAPTFNATFSLSGQAVPEPASLLLLGAGLAVLGASRFVWGRRNH